MKNNILWIILAGGQAKRMGGQDKGLVLLNGIPLVEHVYQNLQAQQAKIAINANRNHEKYQRYAEVFADQNTDFLGPLAGMQAAMQGFSCDWFGFVPCDTPCLPKNLVAKMTEAINESSEILVAFDGERIQPTVCLMKASLLPKITTFLAQGERKLQLFYSTCQTKCIDFSDQTEAFTNLNTPEDLKKL